MKVFREQVADLFIAAFGEPQRLATESGVMFRWSIKRPGRLSLFITLNSPELPRLAHVLITDPSIETLDPVQSVMMRTIAEAEAVVRRLTEMLERTGWVRA